MGEGKGGVFEKYRCWVVAVFAPEIMATTAFYEYLQVRQYFQVIAKLDKGHWTMPQLLFVFMGGVNLDFEDGTETLGYDYHTVTSVQLALT